MNTRMGMRRLSKQNVLLKKPSPNYIQICHLQPKTKKGHWEKRKQSPNPTTLSQGPLARTKNQRACLPRGKLKESEFHGEISVLQQRPTEKIVLINARVIICKGLAHFNLNFRNRFSKLLNYWVSELLSHWKYIQVFKKLHFHLRGYE